MAERVTVFMQGKEYDAVRGIEPKAGQPTSVWRVLHKGAPVTSFATQPGESAGAVKEKILGWLETSQSGPVPEAGRQ